jgi:predicted transcriptional regulator
MLALRTAYSAVFFFQLSAADFLRVLAPKMNLSLAKLIPGKKPQFLTTSTG